MIFDAYAISNACMYLHANYEVHVEKVLTYLHVNADGIISSKLSNFGFIMYMHYIHVDNTFIYRSKQVSSDFMSRLIEQYRILIQRIPPCVTQLFSKYAGTCTCRMRSHLPVHNA